MSRVVKDVLLWTKSRQALAEKRNLKAGIML